MANWIDKTIGYVNPRAGAKRVAYRRQMELISSVRNYEGAAGGRMAANWFAPSGDADTHNAKAGQLLRDRSRDAVRNNPLAAKIVTVHANNFVGPGIVPRAKLRDSGAKMPRGKSVSTEQREADEKRINDLFDEWAKVCHVDGSLDFYGISYLLARGLVQDGEMFVRRRLRRPTDGLPVPLQLQVLDSEFVDWSKTGMNGKQPIINGIEFDVIGRRRGYHVHAQNPIGSARMWNFTNQTSFVAAEDMIHVFEPLANQTRGVPWLSPVLTDLRELRDYEHAENVRKKAEACVVAVVIPGDEEEDELPSLGVPETEGEEKVDHPALRDAFGNPFERMEPGMVAYAHGGKDIKFNTPAISAGVEAYIRTRHRTIAAGVRQPYELMTGDFSQANFASGKLGLLEYQKFVEHIQDEILIFQALGRMWEWFIDAAKLAGKIPLDWVIGVEWQPPEFTSINRLDDARADLIEVRMGKRSMPEIIAKTGRDPDTVLREHEEWWTKADAKNGNLIFDSDPRKVSINGQLQGDAQTKEDDERNAEGP